MSLEQTQTDPPIDFEWHLTGPKGARFVLYPIKDQHSEEDVKRARIFLYQNRDVVSMQVRWVVKGDKAPPPEKIPEFIIIKQLKEEIGKKESYIMELEERARKESTDERRQFKKEIQREELYTKQNEKLRQVEKENKNLRGTISDLVTKLNAKQQ